MGTFEDNDIYDNYGAGVEIKSGGNPLIKGNQIRGGKQDGILVCDQGGGEIVQNDVFGHVKSGVRVLSGAGPHVLSNQVHDCQLYGIHVSNGGLGTFEDNAVFRNARSGICIEGEGTHPTVQENKLFEGQDM